MAEILAFPDRRPAAQPQLRAVPQSTAAYNRNQLIYASEAFAAALAETCGSLQFTNDGHALDETCAVYSGETLQSALTGIMHLLNLRGMAEDAALRRAIRHWQERNGGNRG
ncbi:hypothetical protein [Rhizobium lentis]|uniref:hypothetical protein n=1 Tax=Rhizobium lentis TaxID=1138194 RepID=UPI001C838623|nr:hypothetical protein [Rhizobium lentis]MBX5112722.1 hypothetical protein [Rhizobium lentis]